MLGNTLRDTKAQVMPVGEVAFDIPRDMKRQLDNPGGLKTRSSQKQNKKLRN